MAGRSELRLWIAASVRRGDFSVCGGLYRLPMNGGAFSSKSLPKLRLRESRAGDVWLSGADRRASGDYSADAAPSVKKSLKGNGQRS